MENENYIPFGEEWKAELMKMKKIHIIAMYRSLCLTLQEQPTREDIREILYNNSAGEWDNNGNKKVDELDVEDTINDILKLI